MFHIFGSEHIYFKDILGPAQQTRHTTMEYPFIRQPLVYPFAWNWNGNAALPDREIT